MRSLFLKIFLSYWAAQALFVVLAVVVTLAIRTPDSPRFEWFRMTLATQAAQAYEHGGSSELRHYVQDHERAVHDHLYLFDDKGNELSGRPVPAWAKTIVSGKQDKEGGLWGSFISDLRVTQAVTTSTGQHYTMALERSVGPHLLLNPSRTPGLGMLIAVLTSGLVCFLLARYLTSPVARLRAATQRLAAGDLTARAGELGSRRGDEIAQLVRDFDGMAARIENLVNAQGRLLNDISHELRSPLARLNVALGLARQRSTKEAEGAINRIELEANRLNELIGRLLVLARLEAGAEPAEKVPVHLDELVNEVVKDADFEAQGRNCRVRSVISDDVVVLGNPALLHSAIENVVRNAMRYTHEGTEVEIRLQQVDSANGPEALIHVSDEGPGVPEEALDKLFRPFYRIDDARVRQTGGVGLGLSITERAVRLHQGSVRAANRPGGGLVVELRLPLAQQAVALKQGEKSEVPVPESSTVQSR
jgi:two-component system, OmpR family, sensor histidine kinase CpxA